MSSNFTQEAEVVTPPKAGEIETLAVTTSSTALQTLPSSGNRRYWRFLLIPDSAVGVGSVAGYIHFGNDAIGAASAANAAPVLEGHFLDVVLAAGSCFRVIGTAAATLKYWPTSD